VSWPVHVLVWEPSLRQSDVTRNCCTFRRLCSHVARLGTQPYAREKTVFGLRIEFVILL
jgi:hypothetical protein